MKTALSGLLVAMLATSVPALAQTSTRSSGGNQRQAVSTQALAQTGTRSSGGNQWQQQAQRTQQGWHSGEQSHAQGQARDIQRERHDGDRRGFGQDDRFQRGQGHAYGHDRQDNWRNGHRYGNQVRGWDPSIDRREDRQHDRIAQGIRSGELTQHEAQRLMAEQRMIRQEERRYKSDGVVTDWERRDLQRDLGVASQNIYNETHDGQVRR